MDWLSKQKITFIMVNLLSNNINTLLTQRWTILSYTFYLIVSLTDYDVQYFSRQEKSG